MTNPFDQFDQPSNPFDKFDAQSDKYKLAAQDLYNKQKALGLVGGTTEGLANRVIQGGTLGFGDEILAGLETPTEMIRRGVGPSEGYKYAKAFQDLKNDQSKNNTGALGTAAEIAGSFAPSGVIQKGVQALSALPTVARTTLPAVQGAANNLPAIAGTVAPAASRLNPFGQAIATGAITGGIQGAGDDTGVSAGLAAGALGGAAGHTFGKAIEGATRVLNPASRVAQAPSTNDLRTAAQAAYDRFTNAGGLFTQQGLDDLSNAVRTRLTDMGWQPELAPKVVAFDRAMQRARTGSGAPTNTAGLAQTATPRQIQNLRRIAGNIRNSKDDGEAAYGQAIIDEIDGFLANVQPGQYAAAPGAPTNISNDLALANRLWTQYSKADAVDNAYWKAQNRAASTYSGGNENNAIRQNLRAYWEKRGQDRFTPEENAALQTAVHGGTAENITRNIGKLAASRGGLSAMAQLGAMLHSPHIAIPLELTAEASKYVGDRLTRRNLDEVSRVIRSGGQGLPITPAPSAANSFARRMTPYFAGPGGALAVRGLLDQ